MDGEISRARAARCARGLRLGIDGARRGIPDRGSPLARRRGCACAPAAHDRIHRSPRRAAGRSRHRAHPVRRLGGGNARPETILESLPELRRADGRSHRERRHQAVQGKAAHVCGRGSLHVVEARALDRPRPLRHDRVPRANGSEGQASGNRGCRYRCGREPQSGTGVV